MKTFACILIFTVLTALPVVLTAVIGLAVFMGNIPSLNFHHFMTSLVFTGISCQVADWLTYKLYF